ncbi:MAG TPA: dihydropteroate synthase [Myxococcales bacterium]|jgi:dihydropteroate synthase|nr:dihydropteroate synthase [Myxococcales bacterium]
MRLMELQNERDSVAACSAAGRAVADENLRGWAALLPLENALLEGLKHSGLAVLRGSSGALALGSLSQIWGAARSLEEAMPKQQALLRDLRERAANVEAPADGSAWKLPRSALPIGRVLVMGIVNATPDSFSDGGRYDPVEHALELIQEGADLLDIGGESTRPDAQPVDAAAELERVMPVLRACASQKIPLSIDTTKAEVARAAIGLGAEIVNDVSGLARDPRMGEAVRGAAVLLMHSRGTPKEMGQRAVYQDLQAEILAELGQALQRAREAGIPDERIALDPGLGFAKVGPQNFTVLRRLRELTQLGRPLAVGASRKSFIGLATGRKAPEERLSGSVAAAVAAALNGAAIVRVHDVRATREALLIADAIRTSSS